MFARIIRDPASSTEELTLSVDKLGYNGDNTDKVNGKAEEEEGVLMERKRERGDNEGPPREGRVCAVFRPCAASKRV